jgi:hypothetical protein
METQEPDGPPKLMLISREAVPGALSRAERYRLLNQPWQAESICRDVLAVDPANHAALIILVLSLTDQFERGVTSKEALAIAEGLPNEYDRAYYSGIIQEREATAMIGRRGDYRSRRAAYALFQNAMEWYRKAQAIRPRDNDESVLRWNACVRVLERNWGFQ